MRAEANNSELNVQRADATIGTVLNGKFDIATDQQPIICRDAQKLLESIREIQERVAAMPIRDSRLDDEVIGYNEYGHFD